MYPPAINMAGFLLLAHPPGIPPDSRLLAWKSLHCLAKTLTSVSRQQNRSRVRSRGWTIELTKLALTRRSHGFLSVKLICGSSSAQCSFPDPKHVRDRDPISFQPGTIP